MATDRPGPAHVPVGEERFASLAGGVELCYQAFGDPADEPLLLIMGLGGPMTWWDERLCRILAARGFHVVRYDNRDTGRSSKGGRPVSRADIVRAFLGRPVRAPYTMADLAGDAAGLLDHLGIGAAHVFGVSMGGMIAQTLAVDHPARVRSLVSMMSTTGRRRVGWQHPRLLPALVGPRRGGREAYVERSSAFWEMIGSPDHPEDRASARERAAETWDRGFSNDGLLRQMLAVLTQPDRTSALARVRVPVAVVHGLADPMVHVSGGRATARAVPGTELVLLRGMGHDLPSALFGTFADVVRRTADRAPDPAPGRTRSGEVHRPMVDNDHPEGLDVT